MTHADDCWAKLKPVIDHLTQLLVSASGDEAERRALALLAAEHFVKVATTVFQQGDQDATEAEVMKQISFIRESGDLARKH